MGRMRLISFFKSLSLVTKLMAFGFLLVLFGTMARYFLLADILREDLKDLVASQQFALATQVAETVDRNIVVRKQLLSALAKTLPKPLLQRPKDLQAWLAERYPLNPLFSYGGYPISVIDLLAKDRVVKSEMRD